jgi:hypothetical protein
MKNGAATLEKWFGSFSKTWGWDMAQVSREST